MRTLTGVLFTSILLSAGSCLAKTPQPRPPALTAPPAAPVPLTGPQETRSSRIEALAADPGGNVQAVFLKDGMVANLPPDLGRQLGAKLHRGSTIRVTGTQTELAGQRTLFARSVAIDGQTFTAAPPPDRPDGPRMGPNSGPEAGPGAGPGHGAGPGAGPGAPGGPLAAGPGRPDGPGAPPPPPPPGGPTGGRAGGPPPPAMAAGGPPPPRPFGPCNAGAPPAGAPGMPPPSGMTRPPAPGGPSTGRAKPPAEVPAPNPAVKGS